MGTYESQQVLYRRCLEAVAPIENERARERWWNASNQVPVKSGEHTQEKRAARRGEYRARILTTLGRDEMTASEIAEKMGVTGSAVSTRLRAMRQDGLLVSRKIRKPDSRGKAVPVHLWRRAGAGQ